MKKVTFIITIIAMMASATLTAQNKSGSASLWKYNGKKKEHTLGLYGSLDLGYARLMDEPVYSLGVKAAFVFDKRLGLGLAAKGLSFDQELYLPEDDKAVRLEAGYTGIFIEYILPLGQNFKINLSLLSGMGVAQYRYDKAYHKELTWTEEIPDKTTYSVLEPGIGFQVKLADKWWIGVNAAYRFTSPVEMIHTDEDVMQGYTTGISVKYGIY